MEHHWCHGSLEYSICSVLKGTEIPLQQGLTCVGSPVSKLDQGLRSHRTQHTLQKTPHKQRGTLLQMGVFTQLESTTEGLSHNLCACEIYACAFASCVKWTYGRRHLPTQHKGWLIQSSRSAHVLPRYPWHAVSSMVPSSRVLCWQWDFFKTQDWSCFSFIKQVAEHESRVRIRIAWHQMRLWSFLTLNSTAKTIIVVRQKLS